VTVTDLGYLRPGFGGEVVDADEHPHPAVIAGPGHGGIGPPAQIRAGGDDGAVMGTGCAPTTGSLRGQQPGLAHEAQHPLPTHVHVVGAAESAGRVVMTLDGIAVPTRRVGCR
jgi:hypothetical protein